MLDDSDDALTEALSEDSDMLLNLFEGCRKSRQNGTVWFCEVPRILAAVAETLYTSSTEIWDTCR